MLFLIILPFLMVMSTISNYQTHGMNETKLLQNTCGRKLFAKISGWFEQCLVVFLFVPHVIQVHQTDFLKQKKNINNLTTSGNKKHKKKKKKKNSLKLTASSHPENGCFKLQMLILVSFLGDVCKRHIDFFLLSKPVIVFLGFSCF